MSGGGGSGSGDGDSNGDRSGDRSGDSNADSNGDRNGETVNSERLGLHVLYSYGIYSYINTKKR